MSYPKYDYQELTYKFIYNTVRAYKEFEDFFEDEINKDRDDSNSNDQQEEQEGYLIDKKYLIYWKKFTDYENIKNQIANRSYERAKSIIVKHRKNNHLKHYQDDATQFAFRSPFDLYQSVKMKGRQYVLIDEKFWKLICYNNGLNEEGQMKYEFDKNKIIFNFGPEGLLEVSEQDDNIISPDKQLVLRETNNFSEEEIENINDDQGKSEMNKLLLLYAYEQELKNKLNNLKYFDKDFKFKEYYLISKDWIDTYKEYYHYNELCKLINNKKEVKDLLNSGYENAKKHLPYISNKILIMRKKNKNNFPDILKEENTFLSEGGSIIFNNNNYDDNNEPTEVKYWKKFELVNGELKELLANSDINGYHIDGGSTAKCLISGGKIFLDLSNDQNNVGNYAVEIGVIRDDDMIFVDEYAFKYDSEQAKDNHLNFIKDKFYLFQKDELNFGINLTCNLTDDDGEICGTAFKIPPHD
jgi:hypothetical protein